MSYSSEKQKVLIENLISNTDLFALCSNIIEAEYFNPEFRTAVHFIKQYHEDHSRVPPVDIVNAESGLNFSKRDRISDDVFDYTASSIEKFCRERAVLKEFVEGSNLIEDEDKVSGVIDRLSAAMQISLVQDLGTDVLANVEERVKSRVDGEPYYSTGWDNVDELLGGGIRKTEFLMISANSGGGKSIGLSNLAVAMVEQSLNVLYISLELAESLVCERFEAMYTGWDRDKRIENASAVAARMEGTKQEKNATIYVKYMEGEATNSNDIKAYLKQFETQHGFLPDVLIVDYLDIMTTNERFGSDNVYQKDKITSTQLNAIGSNPRNPMIMATASQQNRGAIDQQDVNQGHIAGGLSKVNIVDVYISIIMSDTMRAQGMAYFKFLKTRSSGGVGQKVPMAWDPKSLWFKSTNGPIVVEEPQPDESPKPKIDNNELGSGLSELLDMD